MLDVRLDGSFSLREKEFLILLIMFGSRSRRTLEVLRGRLPESDVFIKVAMVSLFVRVTTGNCSDSE